jgi:Zn-dependent alcohol dehydrogenase
MKTKAAVLRGAGQDFEITELDLDGPKAGEVLIRYVAAGLCHSDEHLRHGDIVPRFPLVGGHEGAGIIEEVGAGVTPLKPRDPLKCTLLPVWGHWRVCSNRN